MFCVLLVPRLVMVVPRLVVMVMTIRPAWLPPQLHSGLQSLYQGHREGTSPRSVLACQCYEESLGGIKLGLVHECLHVFGITHI